MTQRKWTTTDGWEVLTGWDRPLQHFFVNIDRKCRGCDGMGEVIDGPLDTDYHTCETCNGEGNEYLFNNLHDASGMTDRMGGMSLEQVKTVLELKLTEVPSDLYNLLVADKYHDMGNDVKIYPTQGEERK